jgi:hypothetical protein
MDIDPAEMEIALTKQYQRQGEGVALNKQALDVGRKYAKRENLDRSPSFHTAASDWI